MSKLNEKKILKNLNNNKQLKNFKDTFIAILLFNFFEMCEKLNIDPNSVINFKIYMNLVVEKFKILIEEINKESENIDYEK